MAAPANPAPGDVYRAPDGATYTYRPTAGLVGDPDFTDPFPWQADYPPGHPRFPSGSGEWFADDELPDGLTLPDGGCTLPATGESDPMTTTRPQQPTKPTDWDPGPPSQPGHRPGTDAKEIAWQPASHDYPYAYGYLVGAIQCLLDNWEASASRGAASRLRLADTAIRRLAEVLARCEAATGATGGTGDAPAEGSDPGTDPAGPGNDPQATTSLTTTGTSR